MIIEVYLSIIRIMLCTMKMLPIFESVSHKAWLEIGGKLEWTYSYILITRESPNRVDQGKYHVRRDLCRT